MPFIGGSSVTLPRHTPASVFSSVNDFCASVGGALAASGLVAVSAAWWSWVWEIAGLAQQISSMGTANSTKRKDFISILLQGQEASSELTRSCSVLLYITITLHLLSRDFARKFRSLLLG